MNSILIISLFIVATHACQVDYTVLPPPHKIRLGKSTTPNAGLGMFASENIRMGSIVEHCPLLFIETRQMTGDNPLWKYVFSATHRNSSFTAVALGYCSMYNHSDNPNIRFIQDCARIMRFIAVKTIQKGEEMFINYGKEYWTVPLQLEWRTNQSNIPP